MKWDNGLNYKGAIIERKFTALTGKKWSVILASVSLKSQFLKLLWSPLLNYFFEENNSSQFSTPAWYVISGLMKSAKYVVGLIQQTTNNWKYNLK